MIEWLAVMVACAGVGVFGLLVVIGGAREPKEVLSSEKRQRSSELKDQNKDKVVVTQHLELSTQNYPLSFIEAAEDYVRELTKDWEAT